MQAAGPVGGRMFLTSGFGVDHPEGGILPKAFLFCNQKRNRKKFHRSEAVDARPGSLTLDPFWPPPRTGAKSKEWIRERASPFSNLLYGPPPTEATPFTESKPSGWVLEKRTGYALSIMMTARPRDGSKTRFPPPPHREGLSRAKPLILNPFLAQRARQGWAL